MNHFYTAFYRGDVYQVDLGKRVGSVESGVRPAVILQNNKGNRFSRTLIIVPLTSEIKKINLPVHVLLGKVDGLPQPMMALCEQITTVDKSQVLNCFGQLSSRSMAQVEEALDISLALRSHARETERRNEMLLTLCKHHLQPFFDDPSYRVRRRDSTQEKEPCVMCNAPGYDYMIRNVNKAHVPRSG